jgi:hypothetical protein
MIALVSSDCERIRSRRRSRFSKSLLPQATNRCSTVAAVEDGGATSMRAGFCRNLSASFWISGGMVAEKNSVCRVNGMNLTIRSMSGMKPMSSIRSASSITRSSTPVISSLPRSVWSSRRPGVAISTSAPRSSLRSCSSKETPPISRTMLSGGSCRISRNSRAPGPPVRGSARGSACAACAPGRGRFPALSASARRRMRSFRFRSGRCREYRAFQGLAGLRLPESVLASSSRRQLRRTVLFGLSQDQQKWSIGNVFRFGVCGDARERVVCRGPIGFRIVAAVH